MPQLTAEELEALLTFIKTYKCLPTAFTKQEQADLTDDSALALSSALTSFTKLKSCVETPTQATADDYYHLAQVYETLVDVDPRQKDIYDRKAISNLIQADDPNHLDKVKWRVATLPSMSLKDRANKTFEMISLLKYHPKESACIQQLYVDLARVIAKQLSSAKPEKHKEIIQLIIKKIGLLLPYSKYSDPNKQFTVEEKTLAFEFLKTIRAAQVAEVHFLLAECFSDVKLSGSDISLAAKHYYFYVVYTFKGNDEKWMISSNATTAFERYIDNIPNVITRNIVRYYQVLTYTEIFKQTKTLVKEYAIFRGLEELTRSTIESLNPAQQKNLNKKTAEFNFHHGYLLCKAKEQYQTALDKFNLAAPHYPFAHLEIAKLWLDKTHPEYTIIMQPYVVTTHATSQAWSFFARTDLSFNTKVKALSSDEYKFKLPYGEFTLLDLVKTKFKGVLTKPKIADLALIAHCYDAEEQNKKPQANWIQPLVQANKKQLCQNHPELKLSSAEPTAISLYRYALLNGHTEAAAPFVHYCKFKDKLLNEIQSLWSTYFSSNRNHNIIDAMWQAAVLNGKDCSIRTQFAINLARICFCLLYKDMKQNNKDNKAEYKNTYQERYEKLKLHIGQNLQSHQQALEDAKQLIAKVGEKNQRELLRDTLKTITSTKDTLTTTSTTPTNAASAAALPPTHETTTFSSMFFSTNGLDAGATSNAQQGKVETSPAKMARKNLSELAFDSLYDLTQKQKEIILQYLLTPEITFAKKFSLLNSKYLWPFALELLKEVAPQLTDVNAQWNIMILLGDAYRYSNEMGNQFSGLVDITTLKKIRHDFHWTAEAYKVYFHKISVVFGGRQNATERLLEHYETDATPGGVNAFIDRLIRAYFEAEQTTLPNTYEAVKNAVVSGLRLVAMKTITISDELIKDPSIRKAILWFCFLSESNDFAVPKDERVTTLKDFVIQNAVLFNQEITEVTATTSMISTAVHTAFNTWRQDIQRQAALILKQPTACLAATAAPILRGN